MKRILAVLLAVMLFVAIIPATSLAEGIASNGDTQVFHVATKKDNLHLRNNHSLKAGIITSLPKGTPLTKISSKTYKQDGIKWVNVKTMNGMKGWVDSSLIASNGRADVNTQKDGLNVRAGRGTKYKIYYSIPHGTKGVTVYKINGNWAYVSWNGKKQGWASLGYLKWARW